MLIGTNTSKLLEPWEVENCQREGWKGNLNHDESCHVPTVNQVSVKSMELLLEKQNKHDLNEKGGEDKEETSRGVTVHNLNNKTWELLLEKQYEHDFNEKGVDKEETSRGVMVYSPLNNKPLLTGPELLWKQREQGCIAMYSPLLIKQ